jgi:hypothetical protein
MHSLPIMIAGLLARTILPPFGQIVLDRLGFNVRNQTKLAPCDYFFNAKPQVDNLSR